MSIRTELAAALATALPNTWQYIDHAALPTISRTAVMTYLTKIEPNPTPKRVKATCHVLVMIPAQTGGDGELEDALEQVLDALDGVDFATWDSAEFVTYADTYPAYQVVVTWQANRS